jgi:hypothetical protein
MLSAAQAVSIESLSLPEQQQLRVLLAREQIRDVLLNYCRGVDRMDWEGVRRCFHDDAIDEHGLYSGSIDGFIDFFRAWSAAQYRMAMHLLGNIAIHVQGHQAVTEAYCLSFMSVSAERVASRDFRRLLDDDTARYVDARRDAQSWQLTLGLRLIDRFEQRGAQAPWLIAHRVVLHEWNRLEPIGAELPLDTLLQSGRRDSSDLVFQRLAELAASRRP